MRAIEIDQFGDPTQVIRVVDIEEPPPPGPHEVLVSVELSPLNKHDLLVVGGELGRPPLPHIPGAEGVARVLATGAEVDGLQVGDLVVLPLYAGAWRERLVVPADGLFALPAGGDIEQYSMLGSNPPTAGLMLSECAPLQPGDWVVQNAANSGVGRSLIALAKRRGLKTINLARDEAAFSELTAAGADVVHVDDPDAVGDVRAAIGDARVALAVDSVGGRVVARLLELLSDGGSLVSYSWAAGEPMWVDTPTLVAKHLAVRGFFVGDFDYQHKVVPVIREAAPLVADGTLVVPVAGVYPLEHIHDAVQHLLRGGKILLKVAAR
ncbi:Zn-dependent oxidoreductase, NADPH:quinone reductase [Mycobacterium sp. JS623]|uniref:zinc-dependent alcohol dehydrogenase family protein n=1 Tax=Mycobacterium sp. JS623 TaxID=212767 RepID=UPI0002A5ABCD|nr:zinc-dependent alcohol dehydrogenase family protein [Mycobacterium sp. JS623]AGB24231.1 Zn-dependent oxidoreductase, NADPH:quinone reductase [Mycobacterium sp. JS623]